VLYKFDLNHILFINDPPLPPHRTCRFCRRAALDMDGGSFFRLLDVTDALLLASCRHSLFEIVFYLVLEPLEVDFELPG